MTKKVLIMEILLGVMTEEQAVLHVQKLAEAQGRAVERRCNVESSVTFNDKGFARWWHVDDVGKFPTPGKYLEE